MQNISTRAEVLTCDKVLIGGFIIKRGATPTTVNDNWGDDNKSGTNATGLAAAGVKESAVLANLISGNYTAIIRGAGDTSGVALVEVYHRNCQPDGEVS